MAMVAQKPGDPIRWLALAHDLLSRGQPAALAIIVDAYGSTPRESGSWILISGGQHYGTIGGGNLEYQVAAKLRDCGGNGRQVKQFILGPDMAQCCGGALEILFMALSTADMNWLQEASEAGPGMVLALPLDGLSPPSVYQIRAGEYIDCPDGEFILNLGEPTPFLALFGAGHVGAALCQILAATEWQVIAADTREQQHEAVAPLVSAVSGLSNVAGFCAGLPPAAYALVMTHSHDLDFQICAELLQRPDLSFIGLIGSKSKAARFRHRLKADGFTVKQIARLISPIGITGLAGKHPGTVALSAAAQISQIQAARRSAVTQTPIILENHQ